MRSIGAPVVPVGFDYAQAVRLIHKLMPYAKIAEFLGYESPQSIAGIMAGAIPHHPQGEAIWVLYHELYGIKPPLNDGQAAGISNIQLTRRKILASSA